MRICRVLLSGWISRQQFEETWMSLLGVLNPLPSDAAQTPPTHEVRCLNFYHHHDHYHRHRGCN